jgi:hypothetical protein
MQAPSEVFAVVAVWEAVAAVLEGGGVISKLEVLPGPEMVTTSLEVGCCHQQSLT